MEGEDKDSALNDELGELMVKAQGGDSQAYEELLRRCSEHIYRYLSPRLTDRETLADVLQETLVAIHKARHTFDPARKFVPWMLSLAKYKYIDYLRKWSRTRKLEISGEGIFDSLPATERGAAANNQIGEELLRAIATLPLKQRQAVELLKIRGLSVREAAAEMEASESAVKVTAHRAYKALRKKLKGYDRGD